MRLAWGGLAALAALPAAAQEGGSILSLIHI